MAISDPNNLTMNASSGVPYPNDPDPQTVVLTREDVEEFRAIVRDTCNEELSEQEAWNRAIALVALGRVLLDSMGEDSHDNVLLRSSNVRTLAQG